MHTATGAHQAAGRCIERISSMAKSNKGAGARQHVPTAEQRARAADAGDHFARVPHWVIVGGFLASLSGSATKVYLA